MSKKKYKTADLFAGVGGIRFGFENTGFFETVYANDFDKFCKITYDANFNNAKLEVRDITKVEPEETPDFDVLLAGFPCQAFSIAGYQEGFEDRKGRGNLFFDIVRFLKKKRPAGFLLENVRHLETHDNGRTFKVIKDYLKHLGYHFKHSVLNSMEYGNVPQTRERIFIAGFKNKRKSDSFDFPEKTELTTDIRDLLDDKVEDKYYYEESHQYYPKLKEKVTRRDTVYQWRRVYVRENKTGVCPTLTANMGMGGHNVPIIKNSKGIRKLTPRECFRFQGYPEDFVLPEDVSDTQLYKQAGNSITVPVVQKIAENFKIALDK